MPLCSCWRVGSRIELHVKLKLAATLKRRGDGMKPSNQPPSIVYSHFTRVLTGTPIQNSLDDLYSLFKFIRFDPYDNYETFRTHFGNFLSSAKTSRDPEKGFRKIQVYLSSSTTYTYQYAEYFMRGANRKNQKYGSERQAYPGIATENN